MSKPVKYRMLKVGEKRPKGYQYRHLSWDSWVNGSPECVGEVLESRELLSTRYRAPLPSTPRKAVRK